MLISLGVLIPVAAYINIRNLRKPAQPRTIPAAQSPIRPTAPAPQAAPAGAPVEAPKAEAVRFIPIPVDTSRLKRGLAAQTWGREPLLTPQEIRNIRTAVQPAVVEAPPPVGLEEVPAVEIPLIVNSILLSGEQRVAVINDKLYTVGELVPTGERIIAITRDEVFLERDGTQRLIRLHQGTVEQGGTAPYLLKSKER